MKHFIQQPVDYPIGEKRFKKLAEQWNCWWMYKSERRVLTVPVGYVYDGASVPRFAWSLTGLIPDGLIRAASLAHDVLYRAAGGKKPEAWAGCVLLTTGGNVSRSEADWVFKQLMLDAGIYRHRAMIGWAAVRIGGRRHWGGPSPSGVCSGE